ncbi:hypothetical protein GN244_ATG14705 [Phytophthora infestans]|uniref:Uncharacterized protein n=1 Tax=Phytophthora infestans TaxID=4787 RepID=A0A833SUF0_PHYIN|nr:hypothetical protein GN244_ATG14705 [Phytophthora infestans]KAF4150682.1 hypothetical protein GN958_ATG00129 [Phytophthora infestans]
MTISVLHRIHVSFRANCDDPASRQSTTWNSSDPNTANNAASKQAMAKVATWKTSVRKTEAMTSLVAGMTDL